MSSALPPSAPSTASTHAPRPANLKHEAPKPQSTQNPPQMRRPQPSGACFSASCWANRASHVRAFHLLFRAHVHLSSGPCYVAGSPKQAPFIRVPNMWAFILGYSTQEGGPKPLKPPRSIEGGAYTRKPPSPKPLLGDSWVLLTLVLSMNLGTSPLILTILSRHYNRGYYTPYSGVLVTNGDQPNHEASRAASCLAFTWSFSRFFSSMALRRSSSCLGLDARRNRPAIVLKTLSLPVGLGETSQTPKPYTLNPQPYINLPTPPPPPTQDLVTLQTLNPKP